MKPAGAACATCPARDAPCVLPEFARGGKPRLVVVGEGPGRHELEEGRPFVGASGRMLLRGLRTINVERHEVHWTNAVLCDTDGREETLKGARKSCQARLQAELAALTNGEGGPPVVMPVGAHGLHSTLATTKKPQILKWRGSVNARTVRTAKGDATRLVCPTLHPAFVMRSPAWGPLLEIDVARVGRVLENGWRPPEADPRRTIAIARDYYGLQARLAQLRGDALGFDVETVGLGPLTTALVCFALSDGKLTIVVPWTRASNGLEPYWNDPPHVAALVSAALCDRITVTHNGPAFDHIVAERYGVDIRAWDDTLLMQHALAGHLPKRLQHTVSTVLDVHAWKEDDHASTIEQLWLYNARDTLYTKLAYDAIVKKVRAA